MSESISITNPALTYVSIYEESGERVTSYVTGVHGETVEELMALAQSQYPSKLAVVQDALTYNNALQNDLLYKNGEYVPRPEPTEDEKREAALAALDAEYSTKIGEVESEMAKAKALEDEDYYSDLKAEREELVTEYTEKRGAI
ncbi:MAG TPA: hypothetical protein DCG08_03905 [Dialister sp.]|nr:hypothetical protein [Dialister sp.]